MTVSIRRQATSVALAGLFIMQAPAVGAAPVPVLALIGEVLRGYTAVVAIKLDLEPSGPPIVVRSVELASKDDPSRTLTVPVAEAKIAETDIEAVVDWLAPLPSESRVETLSTLMYYTKPADPVKVNAFLEKLGLVQFSVDGQQVGFFTSGGKQVSEVDGGADSSAGQILDAMSDAVVSLIAEDAGDDQSLEQVVTLSSGDFAALDQFVRETPVERDFVDAPRLSSGDGSASRPALFRKVVAGVEAAVQVQRGLFRNQKRLTLEDLGKAFKDAGLEVGMRLDEKDELVVYTMKGGQPDDVVLSGLKVRSQTSSGSTSWYLDTTAYTALGEQLGKETLRPEFEETYETLGRFEEIETTVSSLEQDFSGGDPLGPDPNGPDEPGSNGDDR